MSEPDVEAPPPQTTLSVNGGVKPNTGLFWQDAVVGLTVVFRVAELRLEAKVKSDAPSGMKQPPPHIGVVKSHALKLTSTSVVSVVGPTRGLAAMVVALTLTDM